MVMPACRPEEDPAYWPQKPSLAWMYAHLAVLHDLMLPEGEHICTDRQAADESMDVVCARVSRAVNGDVKGMRELGEYLKAVRADLQEHGGEPQA